VRPPSSYTIDEGYVREWQAVGRDLERHINHGLADIGRMVRQSGMDSQAAAQALSQAMRGCMSADEGD
jgi:hypothetical protein